MGVRGCARAALAPPRPPPSPSSLPPTAEAATRRRGGRDGGPGRGGRVRRAVPPPHGGVPISGPSDTAAPAAALHTRARGLACWGGRRGRPTRTMPAARARHCSHTCPSGGGVGRPRPPGQWRPQAAQAPAPHQRGTPLQRVARAAKRPETARPPAWQLKPIAPRRGVAERQGAAGVEEGVTREKHFPDQNRSGQGATAGGVSPRAVSGSTGSRHAQHTVVVGVAPAPPRPPPVTTGRARTGSATVVACVWARDPQKVATRNSDTVAGRGRRAGGRE